MGIRERLLSNDPVIPFLGLPGVYFTETSIRDNLKHPEIQYRTLQAIVEEFQPDGIFPFMDLTVEAEALGLKINFPENDNPSVIDHPVHTKPDLELLKNSWQGMNGRMIDFIKLMEMLGDKLDIIQGGYVIGPFTLAGELMGPTEVATNVLLKPDFVKEVLDFSIEVITKYTAGLFAAGAETVAVLEPTAVVLSEKHYREFSQTYFRRLLENIDHKPLILHICGDTTHLLPAMVESGALGLSLDSQVDMEQAAGLAPKDLILMGNLDPTEVFLQGTSRQVESAVRELYNKMQNRDNFVLSSGCDIPLETPRENIDIFMKTARQVLNQKGGKA